MDRVARRKNERGAFLHPGNLSVALYVCVHPREPIRTHRDARLRAPGTSARRATRASSVRWNEIETSVSKSRQKAFSFQRRRPFVAYHTVYTSSSPPISANALRSRSASTSADSGSFLATACTAASWLASISSHPGASFMHFLKLSS